MKAFLSVITLFSVASLIVASGDAQCDDQPYNNGWKVSCNGAPMTAFMVAFPIGTLQYLDCVPFCLLILHFRLCNQFELDTCATLPTTHRHDASP